MLNTPAIFPQVGSYALLELAGETRLVRIQHRHVGDRAGCALVSFPGSFNASGSTTVGLDLLIDGTPLTPTEHAEAARLERELSGKPASTRSKAYRRYMALRERDIRSETMARLMERAGLKPLIQQLAEIAA